MDTGKINTDREIWREREGDLYADSIHVTQGGGIGIDCGGLVIVRPVRAWHDAEKRAADWEAKHRELDAWATSELARLREALGNARILMIVAAKYCPNESMNEVCRGEPLKINGLADTLRKAARNAAEVLGAASSHEAR